MTCLLCDLCQYLEIKIQIRLLTFCSGQRQGRTRKQFCGTIFHQNIERMDCTHRCSIVHGVDDFFSILFSEISSNIVVPQQSWLRLEATADVWFLSVECRVSSQHGTVHCTLHCTESCTYPTGRPSNHGKYFKSIFHFHVKIILKIWTMNNLCTFLTIEMISSVLMRKPTHDLIRIL